MEAKKAFTLVELLTVLAIITILFSLLSPATITIRRYAKETEQKTQITTIGLGLTAFRNDYGDYPPSRNAGTWDYCGSQKLAEALLGRDLLGFHPDSNWDATDDTFYNAGTLHERRGRYIENGTASAFKLNDLFAVPTLLELDTFVICDVFRKKDVILSNGKKVKAGTPILYYRANIWSKQMIDRHDELERNIYNARDNGALVGLGKMGNPTTIHPLLDSFYSMDVGVRDPKMAVPWPYRADSYILISAGADGLYGTVDDIANF